VQRGANTKIRERRVRIFARLLRGFDECVMFAHETFLRGKREKRDFALGPK
jgi:hypothetical protein